MNICVINGSPHGERGTSARYTRYLAKQFPQHSFEVVEAAKKIHALERDHRRLDALVEAMVQADAIVWCFPVYFMLVPAQLKRLMELLFDHVGVDALRGKPCTAVSTSAHFYDHTAHDYLAGVSSDLGLAYVQGFSADMLDLLSRKGRQDLQGFARDFFARVEAGSPSYPTVAPVQWECPPFHQSPLPELAPKTGHQRVVLITDAGSKDRNLQQMTRVFERAVSLPVDRIELEQLRLDGGCTGCMHCADGDPCRYKDEYAETFDRLVRPADVVIYAGAVRDRYLSARLKTFQDRYFRNGHRPVGKRQAIGFIVSGPLGQLAPLNQVLEATVQVSHSHRLGTVTDESTDPTVTTARLLELARAADRWAADPWFAPPNFLGVGGIKIFRDLVYENRGVLSADHRFYRDNGLYDFPQNQWGKRLFMEALLLCKRVPFLRERALKLLLTANKRRFKRAQGT